MRRFDIEVEFMSVEGEDEDDALDRLIQALYNVNVSAVNTDTDWIIVDATEVEDMER
jgi:hypothetical protein